MDQYFAISFSLLPESVDLKHEFVETVDLSDFIFNYMDI